ncbi:MAG: M50 family metallopeptidase, partial [Saprospiraceae bacterium]
IWGVRVPLIIQEIAPNSVAEKAGIKSTDKILFVNGSTNNFVNEVYPILKNTETKNFDFTLLRGIDTLHINLTRKENDKLGFAWLPFQKILKTETEYYSFFQAIPKGIHMGMDLLSNQLKAFGKMFSGKIKAKDSLGGFASIAGMFNTTWDWASFWRTTAIISIILGFMNLLPIPALDGGYVMFLLFEVVTGKKVSDKFMEKATMVGFILLMALLLYANGLDFMRFWNK